MSRRTTFLVCLLVTAICVVFVLAEISKQKLLGFTLDNQVTGRLVVNGLDSRLLDIGWQIGDELVAIAGADRTNENFVLHPGLFVNSTLKRRQFYSSQQIYYLDQARLYESWHWPSGSIILTSGKALSVPKLEVQLKLLPTGFWVSFVSGMLAWLIGLVVWLRNPIQPISRYILMLCFGFFLLAFSSALIELKQVLWQPWLIWSIHQLFVIGHLLFLVYGVAVIGSIPYRLFSNAQVHWMISVVAVGLLCFGYIDAWGLMEEAGVFSFYIADHHLYIVIIFVFFTVISLFVYQWHKLSDPVAKIEFYWLLLAYIFGPILFLVLYLLPMYFDQEPLLTRSYTWPVLLLSICMIVMVLHRFYFLHNELYLSLTWNWVLVTLLFVVFDGLLIYVLQLTSQVSVLLVTLTLIWVYLPIRYWISQKFKMKREQRYSLLLKQGVEQVFAELDGANKWSNILNTLFMPAAIKQTLSKMPTSVLESGRVLHVHSAIEEHDYILQLADKGDRVFYQYDCELVDTLQFLEQQLHHFQQAFNAGKEQERQRILRDLHDQVGHQLLSMVYGAKDHNMKLMAQSVLSQIRHIVRSLQVQPVTIGALVSALEEILGQFGGNTGIDIRWKNNAHRADVVINPAYYLNITNVIRELLSNAIRHGKAESVELEIVVNESRIQLLLIDDGVGFDESSIKIGNGLNNAKQRIRELFGEIEWIQQQGTKVKITIPLEFEYEAFTSTN